MKDCKKKESLFFGVKFQECAVEKAEAVFEKLDINEDGNLDEKEFVEGCLNDERLAKLLNTGSNKDIKDELEIENTE